ncbi:MAG: peptide deformylase [Alphaproteobacteria bacterium]|nr:peptide deformylase [Alphaproteobacteria bacterium]
MAVRPILRAGDPVLSQVAAPVTDSTADDVALLVADMIDSLHAVGGGGLAAPQIGVSRRVVIYFTSAARITGWPDDGPIGMTVLVNPELEPVGDEAWTDWEGCLSMPGMRGRATRWKRIRLTATDLDGRKTTRIIAGKQARTVQHECDHLDGRLYPTRMPDASSLGYLDELVRSGQIPSYTPNKSWEYLRGQDALIARLKRVGRSWDL